MANQVQMINPISGANTVAYSGFSWTCLFFGPFPAIFRGHVSGFVVMFALAIITFGLSSLIFMFTYNGWHRNWLVSKGFRPAFAGAFGPNAYANNVSPTINIHVGDHIASANPALRDVTSGNPDVIEAQAQRQLPSA